MAVGVGALSVGDHAVGLLAIFAFGVGLGLTIPATNLYVAQAYPASRASALSLLNLAWGVGAVGAPPVVALFQRATNVRLFLFGVAAALILMAGALVRIPEPGRGPDDAGATAPPDAPARRAGAAWVFGALLFLYVGTETSVGGWVALFAGRLDLIPETLSVATPSLFWAALLAGRAAVPIVLRRIPEARVLGASLLLATGGVALLAASRSGAVLVVSIMMAGLGLSTVFPLTFAQFTRELGRDAVRSAGSVFVLAGLGGAVLPPLVGFVSTTSGSLSTGLFVPLIGCLAMVALRAWRERTAALESARTAATPAARRSTVPRTPE
jgi:FHS family L-fucose permease-like MFS transporter